MHLFVTIFSYIFTYLVFWHKWDWLKNHYEIFATQCRYIDVYEYICGHGGGLA